MKNRNEQRKRNSLRREYAAIFRHYQLLRGLFVLCRIRIDEFFDVVNSLGLDKVQSIEDISAVRDAVCSVHMNSKVKSRHLYDGYNEIDVYTWGPVDLFFCVGHSLIDKYENLKRKFPDISVADLDSYLESNKDALAIIEHLRNMTLHPGHKRNPVDAFGLFYGTNSNNDLTPISDQPYNLIPELVDLFGQLLEVLHEKCR